MKHKPAMSREEKDAVIRDNFIKLRRDLQRQALKWESRPFAIDLATNNLCNLRCIMCSPNERQMPQSMSGEDLKRICEQVLPTATVLAPSVGGEPFLSDMDMIVEQCRKYLVEMNVITNGTLLNLEKYKRMQDVVRVLHISFDSHIKEIYERIRVGANYEQVVGAIRDVCGEAAKDGTEILLSAVMLKDNVRHLPEYVNFAADIGVHSIEIQKMLHTVPDAEQMDAFGNIPEDEIRDIYAKALDVAARRGLNIYSYLCGFEIVLHNPPRAQKYRYPEVYEALKDRPPMMPAYYVRINPDGQVLPCCMSDHPGVMGNILEQPFEKVWNGKAYRRLRKQLFTGKFHRACRDCEWRIHFKAAKIEKAYAEVRNPKHIDRLEFYEISE